jgi:hypothetical protein
MRAKRLAQKATILVAIVFLVGLSVTQPTLAQGNEPEPYKFSVSKQGGPGCQWNVRNFFAWPERQKVTGNLIGSWTIPAEATESLNRKFGPYTAKQNMKTVGGTPGGCACNTASMVAYVAAESGLQVSRDDPTHAYAIPGVPKSWYTTVWSSSKDVRVKNSQSTPAVIRWEIQGDTITLWVDWGGLVPHKQWWQLVEPAAKKKKQELIHPPLKGSYGIRRTKSPWGLHGFAGDPVYWWGVDLTSGADKNVYAPFPGVVKKVKVKGASGTPAMKYVADIHGTGNWEGWLARYLHIADIKTGSVKAGDVVGREQHHIHAVLVKCENTRRLRGCQNVPLLAMLSRNEWPTIPKVLEHADGKVPKDSELLIPAGAEAPDWNNWSKTGRSGWGIEVGEGTDGLRIWDPGVRTKLIPLLGMAVAVATFLIWFVGATEEKKRKLVLRLLRSIPVLLWCLEKAGLYFVEFCILTTAVVIILTPSVWPEVAYRALRVPIWQYISVASAFVLAYVLLKRGPFSKLKVALLTAPLVTMAIVVWRVGALPAIDFSIPPLISLTRDAPDLPPLELTWWNGNQFTLDPPEEIWQGVWDAGRWSGADPAYLLCLGSSESTRFWENRSRCSEVGACGPFQFMRGTWLTYAPWPGASKVKLPDAAYGAGRMVVKNSFDRQATLTAHRARFTGSDGGACWNRHDNQADYVWRCTQAVRAAVRQPPLQN